MGRWRVGIATGSARPIRHLGLAVALLLAAALLVPAGASASSKVDVFIGFDRTPGGSERAFVERHGGSVTHSYTLVPAVAASIPERAVERISNSQRVTYVEPDVEVFAVDEPDYAGELENTWGVKKIGAGVAHTDGHLGSGVRVAVLDSGIDTQHRDLDYDGTCSDGTSYNTLRDGSSHGTHVAGTVAALRDGKGVVGVGPTLTLCIFKVLSDGGSGSYSDVVAALEWISDYNGTNSSDPIRVTNHSYGSSSDPGTTTRQAFDLLEGSGVLHVAAAGNSGNLRGNGSNCIYPALYDSVMAVAATTSSDGRASFSSTCDELELSAPGVSINSTVPGGGYATKSGTSMASPHVAGTAGLVLAVNPGLNNQEVRALLRETALTGLGSTRHFGDGRVQTYEAVTQAAPAPETTGSISGTVTDSGTTAGISGATVVVDGTSYSATTEGDGSYTISGVPEKEGYTVTAEAKGYASGTEAGVKVVAGEPTDGVDFPLDAIEPGSIAGTVTDSGTGILGATVVVDGTEHSTTTDDGGKYTIHDVLPGTYTVTVTADGYTPVSRTDVVVEEGKPTTLDVTLTLSTDTEVTVNDISYSTAGRWHLRVTVTVVETGDSAPVGGAEVTLRLDEDTEEGAGQGHTITGTTNSDGTLTTQFNNALRQAPCYTTTILDVAGDALTWDTHYPAVNSNCP